MGDDSIPALVTNALRKMAKHATCTILETNIPLNHRFSRLLSILKNFPEVYFSIFLQ